MNKTFKQQVEEALTEIEEIEPWDLEDYLLQNPDALLLDVRELNEFDGAYIKNSLFVPRGILEQSCEWDYSETVPELVKARKRPILIICRSGNRSALAALTMKSMGYENVKSLKLGIKGCNDSDIALLNKAGEEVDPDWADEFINPPVKEDQLSENN